MFSKKGKPQWWQLYVGVPVLVGLFIPEIWLGLPGGLNILAQLAILFSIFMFLQGWMRANRRALMGLDEQHDEWRIRVYEIPPAVEMGLDRREDAGALPRSSGWEVRGVLDTTFQMDESEEATAFPIGSEISYAEQIRNIKDVTSADGRGS